MVAAFAAACETPTQRADHLAEHTGLHRELLVGASFHHVAYLRLSSAGPLLVFIEGDGSPWTGGGREIAADPTPQQPLALELAARTAGAVLYLGRPCYLGLATAAECHPSDWTMGRYSPEVVRSLAVATGRIALEHDFREVILIGYSGGGTLAQLMAPQVAGLRAVVTLSANLDVRAWTAYHGYLPLSGSLDPADSPPLPAGIIEIHLVGGQDRNVPPALLDRYLTRHAGAQVWTFDAFDHGCCWQREWPALLPRIMTQLDAAPAAQAHPDGETRLRSAAPREPPGH